MENSADNPTISFIIVSYNVKDLLRNCLRSIIDLVNISYEVIVVDNASLDNSVMMVKSEFPQVHLISNPHNPGFSAANNQAMRISKGSFLFFLNPDTEVNDTSINTFFNRYCSVSGNSVIAGPRLLNTDGSFQESAWKYPSPLQHLTELFFLHRLLRLSSYRHLMRKPVAQVDFVSGAALLISRQSALDLNGFDEDLFWMDDVDLCKRLQLSGGKTEYFSSSSVVHHSGQSSKKNFNIQISNQIISKLKFYKKHSQFVYFVFSVIILFLHVFTRILIFSVLSLINKSYLKKCRAYLFTFRKFFQFLIIGKLSVT